MADLPRTAVLSRLKGATLSAPPPGAPIIAPPLSPARGEELAGVVLRVMPARAPAPLKRPLLSGLRRAAPIAVPVVPPAGRLGAGQLRVEAGKALFIDIAGDAPGHSTLALSGNQFVRAICMTSAEEPLADQFLHGSQQLVVPPRTRRIALLGDGTDAPVASGIAQESIGIEPDTTVVALGRRLFAAYGCLVHLRSIGGPTTAALDTLPGADLLAGATALRMYFPRPQAGWSLVLTLRRLGDGSGSPADEVAWEAGGAILGSPQLVAGQRRAALIMSAAAKTNWAIDLNLGRQWRLLSAALCADSVPNLVEQLRDHADWDLVDDHFEQTTTSLFSIASLEVTP